MGQLQHEHTVTHPEALHKASLDGDDCVLTICCEDTDDNGFPAYWLSLTDREVELSGDFDTIRRDIRAMLTVLAAARRAPRGQARA